MADPITLKVLTPAGLALEEQAVSVIAPGEVGYLGMLRDHAPLVTTLKPGTLAWKLASGERRAVQLGSGLMEVVHNHVTILTESATQPTERSAG